MRSRFHKGLGVLWGMIRQAQSAPSFDPLFEYVPDPGFDTGVPWTITGTGGSITGSQFVIANGSNAKAQATALATIVPGTYRVTVDTGSTVNVGSMPIKVGGTQASVATTPPGVHTVDIVVASVTDQFITAQAIGPGKTVSLNSIHVNRIA